MYNPKLLKEQEEVLPRSRKHHTLFIVMTKQIKGNNEKWGNWLPF